MSTPVYDPQVIARSWALSTHADCHDRRRRFTSTKHLVEVWLHLEYLVASARSSLGPQIDALELGWVDVGAHAPEGYEPMDDLVECREILRRCITRTMVEEKPRGVVRLIRPRAMWQAWWLLRVRGVSERKTCSAINKAIKCGDLCGEYVAARATPVRWAEQVDRVIEQELSDRRALVPNVVREE